MYNLIKKDFIMNRHLLGIFASFPFYFILLFLNKDGAGPVYSISVIWATILPFMFLSQEEKNKGYQLICSLPVSRRLFFISKYLSAWAVSVLSFFYFLTIGFIIAKILNAPFADSIWGISAGDIFIYLFLVGINISAFFPVLIRFGSVNSAIISIAVINILGLLLMVLKKRTGFFSLLITAAEKAVGAFNYIAGGIKSLAGDAGYYFSLLLLLVFINFISYRVLLFIFRKREL